MDKELNLSFEEKQVLKKLIEKLDKTCYRTEAYILTKMVEHLKLDLEDFKNG